MGADKTLACRDCGTQFVFTSGEQDFYGQKGFSDPSRCPACRERRKMDRQRAQVQEMAPDDVGSAGRGGRRERDRSRRDRW